MPRHRSIDPGEYRLWLGILLDATFDPTTKVINLAARAETLNRGMPHGFSVREAQSSLLAIARDLIDYPDDYPPSRAAEMLLAWSDRWLSADEWKRLQARLRKRRQALA